MIMCRHCGNKTETELHFHHIIPKKIGGSDRMGRIYLCGERSSSHCHDLLHEQIINVIWSYIPKHNGLLEKLFLLVPPSKRRSVYESIQDVTYKFCFAQRLEELDRALLSSKEIEAYLDKLREDSRPRGES